MIASRSYSILMALCPGWWGQRFNNLTSSPHSISPHPPSASRHQQAPSKEPPRLIRPSHRCLLKNTIASFSCYTADPCKTYPALSKIWGREQNPRHRQDILGQFAAVRPCYRRPFQDLMTLNLGMHQYVEPKQDGRQGLAQGLFVYLAGDQLSFCSLAVVLMRVFLLTQVGILQGSSRGGWRGWLPIPRSSSRPCHLVFQRGMDPYIQVQERSSGSRAECMVSQSRVLLLMNLAVDETSCNCVTRSVKRARHAFYSWRTASCSLLQTFQSVQPWNLARVVQARGFTPQVLVIQKQ